MFDPAERDCLLHLARASIRQALSRGDSSLDALLGRTAITPALEAPRGAFVTLKEPPAPGTAFLVLRGCVGRVVSPEPLHRTVIDLAPRAAREDPRFAPVTVEELSHLRIEVTVLGPVAPVARTEDIVPGRHGVRLTKHGACAVFLPQVAEEHGWSTTELLEHLALKAGLPGDGWRDALLEVFCAECFAEGAEHPEQ